MKSKIIEFNSESADEAFDSMPQVGDELESCFGEVMIVGINVVNHRKLTLKVMPIREVKRFEDFTDSSMEWDELPERFLEQENESNFVDKQSLSIHNHD